MCFSLCNVFPPIIPLWSQEERHGTSTPRGLEFHSIRCRSLRWHALLQSFKGQHFPTAILLCCSMWKEIPRQLKKNKKNSSVCPETFRCAFKDRQREGFWNPLRTFNFLCAQSPCTWGLLEGNLYPNSPSPKSHTYKCFPVFNRTTIPLFLQWLSL